MTVRFKNPFGEDRVCPWLGYTVVEPDGVIDVPDDQYPNWVAGGWEPLDDDPSPRDPKPASTPPNPPAPATPPPSTAPPAAPKPAPVSAPGTSAGSNA